MSSNLKSSAVGFALGAAVVAAAAAAAAQPAQPVQHQHQVPLSGQTTTAHTMEDMHKMMADPAKHQQMIERMSQCRDMMSMMMEHMKHADMKKGQPADRK